MDLTLTLDSESPDADAARREPPKTPARMGRADGTKPDAGASGKTAIPLYVSDSDEADPFEDDGAILTL